MSGSMRVRSSTVVQGEAKESAEPNKKYYPRYLWITTGVTGLAVPYAAITWPTEIGKFLTEASPAIVALATLAIGYLGHRQWRTMVAQKDAMDIQAGWLQSTDKRLGEQLELAHKEFILSHQPRFIIIDRSFEPDIPAAHGPPVGVMNFSAINDGGSTAFVVECNYTSFILPKSDSLPPVPPYGRDLREPLTGERMQKGDWIPFQHIVDESSSLYYHWARVSKDDGRIILLGYISYEDDIQSRKKLGFCYAFNPVDLSFIEMGGPNYNYSR